MAYIDTEGHLREASFAGLEEGRPEKKDPNAVAKFLLHPHGDIASLPEEVRLAAFRAQEAFAGLKHADFVGLRAGEAIVRSEANNDNVHTDIIDIQIATERPLPDQFVSALGSLSRIRETECSIMFRTSPNRYAFEKSPLAAIVRDQTTFTVVSFEPTRVYHWEPIPTGEIR
ncbi:MAG: hypothetical protein HYV40_02940 [Candidatus Levybacteria bacterium]|nr:hypothetical protein [Candidatus Levybacteria bacterium]